jgi:hypothetical protein
VDQRAPHAPVTVEKRVDRLELSMEDRGLKNRREIGTTEESCDLRAQA